MSVIAYKFQAPNGAYWYIAAGDQPTIDYWKTRRKLIPLNDDAARSVAATAVPPCDHEWVDARNKAVMSGEFCIKCGVIRSGNVTAKTSKPCGGCGQTDPSKRCIGCGHPFT